MNVFTPARTRDVAPTLDDAAIHLWWLPYQRATGRAPLKALLADYLDTTPDLAVLADDAHGRPHLAGARKLDFNWSHSGDRALVAIARNLPVLGVDIERHRARRRLLELAERFFAADEYALLKSLPATQRDDAFMRLWTAKEAVLKAHGRGIAYGLHRVVFSLHGDRTQPEQFQGGVGATSQWCLRALQPAPGFVGMLAWRGPQRSVCAHTPAAAPL